MSLRSRNGLRLDCKVYIGDLPKNANEKDIETAFTCYGSVRSVWVARNPPGFAFVEFEYGRDAEEAVKGLDGTTICGTRVRVEPSTGRVRAKLRDTSRRSFDPADRCYKCGERGHYAYDCRSRWRAGAMDAATKRERRRGGLRHREERERSRSRSNSRDRERRGSRMSRSRSRSRS